MKKLFSIVVVLLIFFCFSSCENDGNSNNVAVTSNDVKDEKIATFDITYDEFISNIANTNYNYKEVGNYNFENEESNSMGVIYMNPDDEFDIIRIQIRHSYGKVFQVLISYTITDDSLVDTSEKLMNLYNIVLLKLKPNAPQNFLENLTEVSTNFYSEDFENLRISISYEDTNIQVNYACLEE